MGLLSHGFAHGPIREAGRTGQPSFKKAQAHSQGLGSNEQASSNCLKDRDSVNDKPEKGMVEDVCLNR